MGNILIRVKQLILLGGDVLIFYLSLYLTLLIRYQEVNQRLWSLHFAPFTIIFALWVVIFFIQNLYNLSWAKNNIRFFRNFFETLIVNSLVALAFFYFIPFFGITPKTNLLLNILIIAVLIPAWRLIYNKTLVSQRFKSKLIFIGDTKEVRELIKTLVREPQLGYEVIGLARLDDAPAQDRETICPSFAISELDKLLKTTGNNITVILGDKPKDSGLSQNLYKAIFSGIAFVDLISFYETLTGTVPISALSEIWFLENLKESEKKIYDSFKNFIDFLAGLIIFGFFIAVFPFVSLITWLADNGPIFYSQKRIGKNGKIFKIYKFRTMVINAEQDGASFAKPKDKRVTAFGNFLRKTRIDELPQSINMLRGEMSLIGPRPEQPEFVEKLQELMPYYAIRHLVKPGLTGWAQINFPYAGTFEENLKKLQYDIYYIKNRSLFVDAVIMLKTLNVILRVAGV